MDATLSRRVRRRHWKRETMAGALALIAASALLWALVSALIQIDPFGVSIYKTYTLQALAWRRGAVSLGQDYPWLELAVYEGDFYVSFPPIPTVPVYLLTFFFGEAVPDGALVKLYALIAMLACFGALRREGYSSVSSAFVGLCVGFCGSALALSTQGAVWYQAQLCALMCASLAVCLTLRSSMTAALFCFALSVGCRPFDVVYGPVLLFVWWRRQKDRSLRFAVRRLWKGFALGLCVAAALAWYNYIRFGSFLEFGTNYLPEFMRSAHGQFSLSHVASNVRRFLFGLPLKRDESGWHVEAFGFSVFLANPLLGALIVRALIDAVRRRLTPEKAACLIGCAIELFLLLLHRTFGGYQFGARYAVDLLPFAALYVALSGGKRGRDITSLEFALFGAGIALSMAGVYLVHI